MYFARCFLHSGDDRFFFCLHLLSRTSVVGARVKPMPGTLLNSHRRSLSSSPCSAISLRDSNAYHSASSRSMSWKTSRKCTQPGEEQASCPTGTRRPRGLTNTRLFKAQRRRCLGRCSESSALMWTVHLAMLRSSLRLNLNQPLPLPLSAASLCVLSMRSTNQAVDSGCPGSLSQSTTNRQCNQSFIVSNTRFVAFKCISTKLETS